MKNSLTYDASRPAAPRKVDIKTRLVILMRLIRARQSEAVRVETKSEEIPKPNPMRWMG
jgi:hypothetical protein